MISDSMDALEEVLRLLDTVCSGVALSITSKKAKVLAVRPSTSLVAPPCIVCLKLDEEPVAVVEEFGYLGSTITQDCSLQSVHQHSCPYLQFPVQSAIII